MPTSLVSTGIQFPDSTIQTTAATSTVTLLANSAAPYYSGTNYTWTITNYDSYTTYTLTTTNGSVSRVVETITYNASSAGAGGYTINGRAINLTISNSPYFMLITANSSGQSIGQGISVDSSGNVYLTGYSVSPIGGYGAATQKYDSTGAIQFQRIVYNTSAADYCYFFGKSAIDSSGNVYAVGQYDTFSTTVFILVKYDSSGAIQYQKKFTYGNVFRGSSVTVDSSNNIILNGTVRIGPSDYMYMLKLNSSLTYQWDAYIGGSGSLLGSKSTIDSNGNVIAAGYQLNGSYYGWVIKFTSSGSNYFQRYTDQTDFFMQDVVTDSSNNIYAVGYIGAYAAVFKFNGDGTLQWQRRITPSISGSANYVSIAIDSSNNIYITGAGGNGPPGNNSVLLVKYNSSGTLQWQRTVYSSTSLMIGTAVRVDSANGLIYVGGYVGGGFASYASFFSMCVPTDGTKTGTFSLLGTNNVVYAASSLTESAGVYSFTASGLGYSTINPPQTNLGLTDAATSYTNTRTTL